jgi:CRISPR-associated protein Csb3
MTPKEAAVAEAFVPVDLLNPGQVFACIGLVEAADQLLGKAAGCFDWTERKCVFRLRAGSDGSPVERVLRFLDEAAATAGAPVGSASYASWNKSWGATPSPMDRGLGYPYSDPQKPATLVCLLSDGEHTITLDHWGDETRRDNVKFWAGAGGYPGSALARDALKLIDKQAASHSADPFTFSAPQSSSFRLDWRRDYVPIDAGFSLNKHGDMTTVGFPIVELLAAIGLSNARPKRPNPRDKLVYEYAVVGRAEPRQAHWLPPSILRVALGTTPVPFPTRRFRMLLSWPGKEGQARSITTVIEESTT